MYRKKEREECRKKGDGRFHFCTDGWKDGKLFHDVSEYAFGMTLIGLISHRYTLKIYAFTLMPNHIHIILDGSGDSCLQAFDYMKMKLTARLKKDGHSPLPNEYWFRLEPIVSQEQLKNEIVYVLRNPLEKDFGMVGGYLWSSGWLYHSSMADVLSLNASAHLTTRAIRKLTGGDERIPENWIFHPCIGLLPSCFVETSLVKSLFPDAKTLQTALVKDFEVLFQIANRMGELVSFNKEEITLIVSQILQKRFQGKTLNLLSELDRGKLAIILNREYGLSPYQISTAVFIKEKTIRQMLQSKALR